MNHVQRTLPGTRMIGMALLAAFMSLLAPLSAGEAAAPTPSKIAVIFLEKVLVKSERLAEIRKVAEDRASQLKQLQSRLEQLDQVRVSLQKDMSLGTGDPTQAQQRWLAVMQQVFQVQTQVRQLQADSRDQISRMLAALYIDINKAIEQIAIREKIDIVINRKDAELAAVEQKKLRDELLEKAGAETGAKPTRNDEDVETELKQQMLSKLENTFVWSNDSMDITDAALAQLNQDYKDNKFTNWRDMPSVGDDNHGAGPGPTGAPAME